jgi:hypothetical protein
MKKDILKLILLVSVFVTAIWLRHDHTNGHDHEVLHGYDLRS